MIVIEKPILFSGPMVRAILDGRKTQTRRLSGLEQINATPGAWRRRGAEFRFEHIESGLVAVFRPRYPIGTRLWVREAWRAKKEWDDFKPSDIFADADIAYEADKPVLAAWGKLRPSMFMPRKASRITLEVTGVRVERVQEASVIDLVAEGCARKAEGAYWAADPSTGELLHKDFRAYWQERWSNLHGPHSWTANPWVWVYEFRRRKP